MTYNSYYLSKKTQKELKREAAKATAKKISERIIIFCWLMKIALSTFIVGLVFFTSLFLLPAFFH